MNPDQLRAALADLSKEARDVDLVERVVTASRRLRGKRLLTGSATAVLVMALVATGSALALDRPPAGRDPVGAASAETGSGTPEPSGSLSASPDRTPTRTRTPAPGGTQSAAQSIPATAMLRPADVGPAYRGDDSPATDPSDLGAVISVCGQEPAHWSTRTRTLGFRQRAIVSDDGVVRQETSRQKPGLAADLLADLRAVFAGPCATVRNGGSEQDVSRFTVVDSGVFGDSSVMIREERTTPDGTRTEFRFAIRQGDVFTEIRTAIDGFSESQARALAGRAADRLCEATTTC